MGYNVSISSSLSCLANPIFFRNVLTILHLHHSSEGKFYSSHSFLLVGHSYGVEPALVGDIPSTVT